MIIRRNEWLDLGDGEVVHKLIICAVLSLDGIEIAQRVEFSAQARELRNEGYQSAVVTTTHQMYFSKLAIEAITERLFFE